MIVSLGAWALGSSLWYAVGAGVLDSAVLVPGVANGVMLAVQKGASTEDMAEDAQSTCNQARWAMHKAKQLDYEAVTLTKDIKGMVEGVDVDLLAIEENTRRMLEQIGEMKRMFAPMLILSIVGAVSVVVVFAFVAASRGKHLRSELDSLRTFESKLPEPASA